MNFRTLDLNLLRVFDEVMAERNLTRAAQNLSMTQPAVSNALRRMREAIGDELVVRSGYGVEPTPRATEIWPAVREALGRLKQVLVPTSFDPTTSDASFVVATADATAAVVIPNFVETLETSAPRVMLRVLPLTTRDPRGLLETSEVDAAIGYFPVAMAEITERVMQGGAAPILYERLYESRYVCVMRRGHPLASEPLTLDAYCAANHLLVSFTGRPFGFIDRALAAIKRERRIVLTVNQFFTAAQVVAKSNLLTTLPEYFVASAQMGERLEVRTLPFEVSRVEVEMLWHRRHQDEPAHIWLRQQLAAAARRAHPLPLA